jgi:hypothetical protein
LITVTAANIQDVLVVTHPITIYTPAESDFVAAPTFGPAPLTVAFTNTSSGDYAAVWWDLGDGTTSTLASPTHIFATAGTYTVALTVSGTGGTDGLTVYLGLCPGAGDVQRRSDFRSVPIGGRVRQYIQRRLCEQPVGPG